MRESLLPARIEWSEDGTVSSLDFDDIYFSPGDGLAEARHVFLGGNDLQLRLPDVDSFRVVETGFGTGLNYLATRLAWRQHRRPESTLHYVSIENRPAPGGTLDKLVALHPHLEADARELECALPPCESAVHDLPLSEGVTLTLLFMDLAAALPLLEDVCPGGVDAWYLDGFAPACNPGMWTSELFQTMARLRGSFATFTVAQRVRLGLEAAGVPFERRPGVGNKREMLVGGFHR